MIIKVNKSVSMSSKQIKQEFQNIENFILYSLGCSKINNVHGEKMHLDMNMYYILSEIIYEVFENHINEKEVLVIR